jgi:hypothetical protein
MGTEHVYPVAGNGGTRSVPFHSQIVNWHGEDSGFPTVGEANEWQQNGCGIACLRMILDHYRRPAGPPEPSYWQILGMAVERGAYSERGWIHQGLLDLAGSFGLSGRCHRQKGVADLVEAISRRSICIVSVTVGFLGGEADGEGKVRPTGGHLVVAYGLEPDGGPSTAIRCNHPSSREDWNKAGWGVDLPRWESSFSGNFIEFFGGQGEQESA